VPIYALGVSSLFCLLAFMNVSSDSTVVFGYFVNLVTIFGILTWISILVTHIYFVRARRAQGVTDEQMAYTAPFGATGSYIALAFCILIAIFKNFSVFTHSPKYGKFDHKNFVTGYLGIPLYLILIGGHKLWIRNTGIRPENADLFSGKDRIDREEEEFLRLKAEKGEENKGGWFYKTFISWLL
jgi:yeast amino acid transporter